MATQTPNIGLTLPIGTEHLSRSIVNNNNTIIDTKMGAVGNTDLQTQVNNLNTGKVNTSDIANNLTTTTAGKVLDARQGKALSDQIANTSSTFKTSGTITVEQQVSGVQIDANRIMCGVILPFVIYSSGSTVTVNSCTILGVGSATATVDAKTTNSIRFSISHSGTAGQAFFIVINFTITLT